MKLLHKIAYTCILLSAILLPSCSVPSKYSYESVKATVVDRQYFASYITTTYIMSCKVMIPVTQSNPARYDVELKYNTVQSTIDDESLYDQTANSNAVDVYLKTAYDQNEKVLYQSLVKSRAD